VGKGWYFRFGAVVAVTLLAVGYVLPSVPGIEKKLPAWYAKAVKKRIQLGLDLQGGIHLVYEVEVDKAVSDRADRLASDLEEKLEKDRKVTGVEAVRKGRDDIELRFKTPADVAKVDKELLADYRATLTEMARDAKAGTVLLRMDPDYVAGVDEYAVRQAIETIRGRVDKFGVAEPTIIRRGRDIVVELPGLSDRDRDRVKNVIGRTAQLEFKMCDETAPPGGKSYMQSVSEKVGADSGIRTEVDSYNGLGRGTVIDYFLAAPAKDDLDKFFTALPPDLKLPDTHQVLYSEVQARSEKGIELPDKEWRTYYVKRRSELTGESITDSTVTWDEQSGRPEVSVTLDRTGADIFEKLSGENIGNRMAIILDDKVNSAPVIQDRIPGGRVRITLGGFGDPALQLEEANDLASVLRTGALPAPLKLVFETVVGPTLGADAIKQGKRAFAVGAGIVAVFMLFYYRLSGLFANLALILNLVWILAIMAGFEAALTLPGIAGLVLTVGMAVDANVIIHERIREELRLNKSPRQAVDTGYDRAFWTIFDSQLTTAIAGFVLLQYGSGPLRGFAVTLLIGILCSVVTGVFVTRVMFDLIVERLRVKRLSI
jgi:preprotein translocase subunit SecD